MVYLPDLSKSPWIEYEKIVLPGGVMPKGTFDSLKHRGNIRVNARGGNGSQVYVEFDTMPLKYRDAIVAKHGDPKQVIASEPMKALLVRDESARVFYATYELPNGEPLPMKHQLKYSRSCDWLNLIARCLEDKRYVKDHFGISIEQLWENVSLLINNDEEEHDLPGSVDRLRRRYKEYREKGREGMIEAWRFGNDFRRKVTPKIEGLILAMRRMAYKPTAAEIHRIYNDFMAGKLNVIDLVSAEIYNPEEFCNNGKAYELSDSTIAYYLNTPKNKAAIDKERMSNLEYNNTYRPHIMRTGPQWAFSKVTMDDTSSPFKMHNGDRPATYKMFDVASTALLMCVMHDQKRPDATLIRSLIAGVIGLIAQNGWKMPAEIEMERAITSSMAGDGVTKDVLSAGAVFPYTRWCKAKNPQEKRAEGFIKQIKYGYQKHREGFQMRPFAKRTENRANEDAETITFTYAEIYQMEMEDMMLYNSALHPDQETYPGLSRWQVLEQFQNPQLPVLDLSLVMPYVGRKTKTSVRRMRVQVQGELYNLPNVALLGELADEEVVAYYLPDDYGEIASVFLYQDGKFLCEAKQAERFQEAKVEQTAEDLLILARQKTYEAQFDKMVEAARDEVPHVGVLKPETAAKWRIEAPVEAVGVEAANDERRAAYDQPVRVNKANDMF